MGNLQFRNGQKPFNDYKEIQYKETQLTKR